MVRKEYWGYGKEEDLSSDDLLQIKYQVCSIFITIAWLFICSIFITIAWLFIYVVREYGLPQGIPASLIILRSVRCGG